MYYVNNLHTKPRIVMNTFNNKSRFSVLAEDTNNTQSSTASKTTRNDNYINETTSYNSNYKSFNQYSNERSGRNRFNYDPEKEKQKAIEIEKERVKKNLDINSFPELCIVNKTTQQDAQSTLSFLEKVKTQKEIIVENSTPVNTTPDGCVTIYFNAKTRTPEYNFGDGVDLEQNSDTDPNVILKLLVEVQSQWKKNYISLSGDEDYNRIYVSPNYDYTYFDKLDEQYEAEMEDLTSSDEEYDMGY